MSAVAVDTRFNVGQWADALWRLSNLYWIVTDEGKETKFTPNSEQLRLLENWWCLNLILKARQLGFSTLIDLVALDQSVFNANHRAAIIADSLKNAKNIFRTKIKFPYDHLPQGVRDARPLMTDSKEELIFSNGSSIGVGTSARSDTLQFLHVSEFGKICAKYPEKAREIVTGSLNTLKAGQTVCIESTAEGRGGYFFTYCQVARALQKQGTRLTPLDFRFHFFPWWQKQDYRLDPAGIPIPASFQKYFADLALKEGIKLDAAQKVWYVKKAGQMLEDNTITENDDMKREFPATPDEAFAASVRGSIFGKDMAKARAQGRIRKVPHVDTMPVNTYWDLGRNNTTVIWFHQFVAGEHRFFDYYETSGEGLAHYYKVLQDRGYIWGKYYLPHDAENQNLEHNQSRVDRFVELGMRSENIIVVPRIDHLDTGIELVRTALPLAWFDEEKCERGIAALESYQYEWDEVLSTFRRTPLDNWACNGADAFRQWAQGWKAAPRPSKGRRASNWRTA